MVQNAAHSLDFTTLITNREVMIADNHVFNTKIPIESMVTNQKSSGRCWIFAALNVFRVEVMKKYNLEEFELSQGYLFFWDKFEKSNCKSLLLFFVLCLWGLSALWDGCCNWMGFLGLLWKLLTPYDLVQRKNGQDYPTKEDA